MIQRKQTLYLFLVAAIAVVLVLIPVQYLKPAEGDALSLSLTSVSDANLASLPVHYVVLVLNFPAIVLSFTAIFLYKKRAVQIRLCYVNVVFFLVNAGLVATMPLATVDGIRPGFTPSIAAIALMLAGVIFSILAARLVKKDIELLKSVDRIR